MVREHLQAKFLRTEPVINTKRHQASPPLKNVVHIYLIVQCINSLFKKKKGLLVEICLYFLSSFFLFVFDHHYILE